MRKYAKFPIAHILDWKISIKDFFILTKSTDFDLAQKQLKKVDSFVEKDTDFACSSVAPTSWFLIKIRAKKVIFCKNLYV